MKIVPMSQFEIGITAPPFHNFCRGTTIPYLNDEFTQNEKRAARDTDTGKTVYIDDMSYKDWKEKFVSNDKFTSVNNNDIMKKDNGYYISTEGKRYEKPLTNEQIETARKEAVKQGYTGDILYSQNSNTAFHGMVEGEKFHYLVIGTDAYLIKGNNNSANERITVRGCMAHEVIGHYEAWKKGTTQSNLILEEAQASIRAAKF